MYSYRGTPLTMSKTISVPEDLYEKLDEKKAPRQPFSGVIEGLIEGDKNE